MSLPQLSSIPGHSKVTTTMNVYTYVVALTDHDLSFVPGNGCNKSQSAISPCRMRYMALIEEESEKPKPHNRSGGWSLEVNGARDRVRTGDPQLGKLTEGPEVTGT